MNTYKLYQVDAFAEKLFTGNPAAVCPLDSWISDDLLQKIAMENNLAETAFYVGRGDRYEIRWFTPNTEVDLCGHATLAAAHVLFEYEDRRETPIRFYSPRSGELQVSKKPDGLTLDFPADEPHEVPVSDELLNCFDKKRKARGVIVTAKGEKADFVSRFFAPQSGVAEDPVTGSAHTTLAPYWAAKYGKTELSAIQLSARKGYLRCRVLGERVEISGRAELYLQGEIYI